jgi:glucan 1,3-beta-glucosidase
VLAAAALAFCVFGLAPAADSKNGVPLKNLPPLRVKGTKIVADSGKEIVLRGVNLGTWFSVESHFTGIQFKDEKSLWDGLSRRHGKEGMEKIRQAYRTVWITAKDFERVRDLGLNHVRVPFWYGLLEDDTKPGKYLETGWKWLDSVVDWSERAGIYCVLDLHGAPGGQSKAEHTGESDRNALWNDPPLRKRTADLWTAIAKRYKGRASIAAFDLLNEPMGAPSDEALVALNFSLLRAVRKADPTRLVVLEDGYRGLGKFPRTSPQLRGVIYSQHHYPTMQAKASPEAHTRFFTERFPVFAREQMRYQAPLYIGEWSVIQDASGGGPMTRRHIKEMEKHGWSWCLWLYKQSNRGPVSQCWGIYRNNRDLDLPDMEKDSVEKILTKLEALRTENMILYEPLRAALAEK